MTSSSPKKQRRHGRQDSKGGLLALNYREKGKKGGWETFTPTPQLPIDILSKKRN